MSNIRYIKREKTDKEMIYRCPYCKMELIGTILIPDLLQYCPICWIKNREKIIMKEIFKRNKIARS